MFEAFNEVTQNTTTTTTTTKQQTNSNPKYWIMPRQDKLAEDERDEDYLKTRVQVKTSRESARHLEGEKHSGAEGNGT